MTTTKKKYDYFFLVSNKCLLLYFILQMKSLHLILNYPLLAPLDILRRQSKQSTILMVLVGGLFIIYLIMRVDKVIQSQVVVTYKVQILVKRRQDMRIFIPLVPLMLMLLYVCFPIVMS